MLFKGIQKKVLVNVRICLFSEKQQMMERIRQRIDFIDELTKNPNAEYFKSKLSSEQIAFVDLLYESIYKNPSASDRRLFSEYALSSRIKEIPAEEIFLNTLSIKKEEFDPNVDIIEKFYNNSQKFAEVYEGMEFSTESESNQNAKKASKNEKVAVVELEKPKVD